MKPLQFTNCVFGIIRNRYGEALSNYEKGMDNMSRQKSVMDENTVSEHLRSCKFGIARTNVKIGNYKKGVSLFSFQSNPIHLNFLTIDRINTAALFSVF